MRTGERSTIRYQLEDINIKIENKEVPAVGIRFERFPELQIVIHGVSLEERKISPDSKIDADTAILHFDYDCIQGSVVPERRGELEQLIGDFIMGTILNKKESLVYRGGT